MSQKLSDILLEKVRFNLVIGNKFSSTLKEATEKVFLNYPEPEIIDDKNLEERLINF